MATLSAGPWSPGLELDSRPPGTEPTLVVCRRWRSGLSLPRCWAMDLIADLHARGLIQVSTDLEALAARLAEGPITIYYGCDPTADSLHIGNLIGLIVLRRFAERGHHAIALAGGATGMVGDPGGRSEERNLLDEATLRANAASIKAEIGRVLAGIDDWELVDNLDWTKDLTLLAFLREVGKHVTVNQMTARESVK